MLGFILLQSNVVNPSDTLQKVVSNIVTPPMLETKAPAPLPLMDLLIKGGWVMIPIAILLLLAVFFFFERLMAITRSGRTDKNFMNNIRDMITNGNIEGAKAFCKSHRGPQARVVEKGLSRLGKPIKEIEEAMSDVGKLELYQLEKNLNILSVVGRIAPMLGFIGTIIGVINIFYKISLAKVVEIDVISEGLYQKMITSASGLAIGVFAFVCYHVLSMMVDKIVNRMETTSVEFIDLLNQPSK
jgi:biopolymer transport protein ExbB